MNALMLAISLWTTLALKILTYIYFAFLLIGFLIIIIAFLRREKIYIAVIILKMFTYAFGLIILSVNIDIYRKYLKQCPYRLNKLSYSKNLERRCELFNINRNSRYAFQYICSYNSSKEFNYKLDKEIKEDKVICMPIKKLILDNQIILLFFKKYINYNNYYCFRTNIPKNYTYINPENCNNKSKFTYTILLYVFFLIQFITFIPRNNFFWITAESLENSFFDESKRKWERYYRKEEEIKKQNIDDEKGQTENNRRLKSVEINNNISQNQTNTNDINKNKESNENHEISEKKENNETNDNNNLNKEKNNNENNNIDNVENKYKNIEKKEIIKNDKNDAKTSISVVVENKNELSIEKGNKNTHISKDYKLQHSNSINLDQIEFGFVINSEADTINKNIDNKN